MALELEEDPEQLMLLCIPLLGYARAKRDMDSTDKATRDAWEGSKLMQAAITNDFDLRHRARAHKEHVDGCATCERLRA